jgi:hypothetical protein
VLKVTQQWSVKHSDCGARGWVAPLLAFPGTPCTCPVVRCGGMAACFRLAPSLPAKVAVQLIAEESFADPKRSTVAKVQAQVKAATQGVGAASDGVARRVREAVAPDGGGRDVLNSETDDFKYVVARPALCNQTRLPGQPHDCLSVSAGRLTTS